jgi:hypothetical protein
MNGINGFIKQIYFASENEPRRHSRPNNNMKEEVFDSLPNHY